MTTPPHRPDNAITRGATALDRFRLLGRSGLRVSPLSLAAEMGLG